MRGIPRKHKIKRIGDGEYQIRLNDHVLLEWETESNGVENIVQLNAVLELGDICHILYIVGLQDTEPLSEWELEDDQYYLGTNMEAPLLYREHDNLALKLHHMPSILTWVKMAREKGAF